MGETGAPPPPPPLFIFPPNVVTGPPRGAAIGEVWKLQPSLQPRLPHGLHCVLSSQRDHVAIRLALCPIVWALGSGFWLLGTIAWVTLSLEFGLGLWQAFCVP